jgi:hypothetical protein
MAMDDCSVQLLNNSKIMKLVIHTILLGVDSGGNDRYPYLIDVDIGKFLAFQPRLQTTGKLSRRDQIERVVADVENMMFRK